MLANNFVGTFDVSITCRELDVALGGQIGALDYLVFVAPDQQHRGPIGISCDGVQPKFDEPDRVRFVALAVFVAS